MYPDSVSYLTKPNDGETLERCLKIALKNDKGQSA
jgi:hypothetical protein